MKLFADLSIKYSDISLGKTLTEKSNKPNGTEKIKQAVLFDHE